MNRYQTICTQLGVLVAAILLIGVAAGEFVRTHNALAQTATSTVTVQFEKKFSGTQEGFAASEFSFHVTGDHVDETVPHGESVALPLGDYEIEEIGPVNFNHDVWLTGWFGACTDGDDDDRTALISIDNPNMTPLDCQADNQYQPAVLQIIKIIAGNGATSTPDDFSYTVRDEDGAEVLTQAFEADGTTELDLAPGIYSVTEASTTGYVATYENCDSIDLSRLNATGICRITNTFTGDDNGGGGEEEDEKYRIEGIVWHDDDQDGTIDEDENRLSEWTVTMVNTEDVDETQSDTTDENGRYSFEVTRGTWEIAQEARTDAWFQTYPDTENGTYVVTVPLVENETLSVWKPFRFIVAFAEAQTIETYSGYDFGNDLPEDDDDTDNGGGGGDDNDDNDNGDNDDNDGSSGQSGRSRSGGGDGDDDDDRRPSGQVAGEQTTVVPLGAANAGYVDVAEHGFVSRLWRLLASLF